MSLLWSWFAFRHVNAFLSTNQIYYLVVCFSEALGAIFFLLRQLPLTVSPFAFDWILAIGGTFISFLLIPMDQGLVPLARHGVTIGTGISVLGLISLNRSFSLVPAHRTIKTNGMYRLVRHPLYFSYLLTLSCYVLANTGAQNIIVFTLTVFCMGVRMFREERHLAASQEYRDYMRKVRHRIIPFVF